jgi:PIN domain nuclease of toxin-antitoxin system
LQPDKLTSKVSRALTNPETELWLSSISVWEAHMLSTKGRLELDEEVGPWIEKALRYMTFHEAPITWEVAMATATINLSHKDPADRFLAATAKVLDLTLVTADDRLIDCPDISVLANR